MADGHQLENDFTRATYIA